MKHDWIKQIRLVFLDMALACSVILWVGFMPTWKLVGTFIALYFAFFILGAVVDAMRDAKDER